MSASAPTVEDLGGVWSRRSIRWPNGRSDTTTRVTWIQGRQWFVDLRRPAVDPAVSPSPGGECAPRMDAFAGRLSQNDSDRTQFMWDHTIDWSPDPRPDVGRLRWEGDTLVEEGVLEPYREVWIRTERHEPEDSATALLHDDTGRVALLLRSAGVFGYAVSRGPDGQAGRGPTDCEVAIGTIDDKGWWVSSSTRSDAAEFPIVVNVGPSQAQMGADTPMVAPCLLTGRWQIGQLTGDPALLQTSEV
ncbi:hypothetical protein [Mycobacterium sherrisii]|nr:hypothetical protein [Mycobacterium sherrisii]